MANCAVTKQFGVVFFMLIVFQCGWCKDISCDVNHCKSLFSTLFNDFLKTGPRRLCRSSDDTKDCVNECLRTFFPDFDFVNSNTHVTKEICSDDFEYELSRHWNCISSHLHRLITCMSFSGSMVPTNVSSETLKLLPCRKYLETLNCPYRILHDCKDEAIDVVNELFSKVFKTSREIACHLTSSNVAFDLPVTYSLNNSYLNSSTCLDSLPTVAGNCFWHYLQNFETDDLYHCRHTCEKPDGDTCLPSALVRDFYIPILSFGKRSCEKNTAKNDELQMQEPSKSFHDHDLPFEVYNKDSTVETNPTESIRHLISSVEAKRPEISSLDYKSTKASTSTPEEIDNDDMFAKFHSSSPLPRTSIVSSNVRPESNDFASDNSAEQTTEINSACQLKLNILCLFFLCIYLLP